MHMLSALTLGPGGRRHYACEANPREMALPFVHASAAPSLQYGCAYVNSTHSVLSLSSPYN